MSARLRLLFCLVLCAVWSLCCSPEKHLSGFITDLRMEGIMDYREVQIGCHVIKKYHEILISHQPPSEL